MRTIAIVFILAFMVLTGRAIEAQQPPAPATEYAAPDAVLWNEMKAALTKLNISLESHQHVANIVQSIERAAAEQASKRIRHPAPAVDPKK